MVDKIKVREYQDADKDEVYSLILSIMEQEFEDIPASVYLEDIGDIINVYGGERDHFYVCEKDGRIIATVGLKEDDEENALLRRLFVNPHFRGTGLGSELVKKALQFCKKHKYKKVFFSGNIKMNKVRTLLKKQGFKEDETILSINVGIFKLSYDLSLN